MCVRARVSACICAIVGGGISGIAEVPCCMENTVCGQSYSLQAREAQGNGQGMYLDRQGWQA